MKGQLNIEFISAIIVFILAVGSVAIFASDQIPDVEARAEETYSNLEAHRISSHMMTSEGYSSTYGTDWDQADLENVTEVGLSNGKFNELDRAKLKRLRSFTRTGGSQKFNYSRFKHFTGVEGQYHFNFTWMPIIQTTKEIPNSEYSSTGSSSDNLELYLRGDGLPLSDSSGNDRDLKSDDVDVRKEGALETNHLYFDGSQRVRTENEISASDSTITFWMKPRDFDEEVMAAGFPDSHGVSFDSTGDSFDVKAYFKNPRTNNIQYFLDKEISRNEWVHVALRRGSNGDTDLFIDGYRVASADSPRDASGDFWVGRRPGDPGFEGGIDEIRVYSEALSGREIRDISDGVDEFSKLDGEPVQLPGGVTGSTVSYGETSILGGLNVLNAETSSGMETYISSDSSFSGDKVDKGDQVLSSDLRVKSIDEKGKYVVLRQNLKEFGPRPPERSSNIGLTRFAVMEEEPVKVEVRTW
jgi:hypothetical protein